MSDQVINQPDLRLTRSQIQKFVGDDPQSIRILERQIQYVNELYRKPSIHLLQTAQQTISGVTDLVWDTLAYSNSFNFDASIDPTLVTFNISGRYRVNLQISYVYEYPPVGTPPFVAAYFRLNGTTSLPESFIRNYDKAGVTTFYSDSFSMFSYITDISAGDTFHVELQEYNMTTLKTTSISGLAAKAVLVIERVY